MMRYLTTALLALALAGPTAARSALAQSLWTDGDESGGFDDDDAFTFGAFADLADHVAPAVVYIEVTIPGGGFFMGGATGQGSGFFINSTGTIVTNNHVIEGASSVTVTLQDGRSFDAEVVGSDPRTDLALIEVDAGEPLPFLPLGSSADLRVGEWVLAVGSPFGLESTVTVGVVSALNRRDIQPDGRALDADFIQTDASINPGNSGGPLIDLRGNVIGVNAAVRSGNNIGFAIPIDMVKRIIEQLADGRVVRSWLGVTAEEFTQERAQALGLDVARGALVGRVVPGSPAEAAGLVRGDVILEFGGEAVDDFAELRWLASIAGIDAEVPMRVWRDGEEVELTTVMTALPGSSTTSSTPGTLEGELVLGCEVVDLDEARAEGATIEVEDGVYVVDVTAGSAAAQGGITSGDVIVAVGGEPVEDVDALEDAADDLEEGELVRVRLQRGRALVFVTFTVPEDP